MQNKIQAKSHQTSGCQTNEQVKPEWSAPKLHDITPTKDTSGKTYLAPNEIGTAYAPS